MDELIAVYLEDINTGGQTGFEFFEDEKEAEQQFKRVQGDIIKYGKESIYKVVKRVVNYDKKYNRVSFT